MNNKSITGYGSIFLLTLALMLVTTLSFSQQRGTNFSGTWAINETKSDLGEGPMRFAQSPLVVKQDRNNLTVDRSMSLQDGNTYTSTDNYTLDGQNNVNEGFMDSKVNSTVTWSDNRSTLSIKSSQAFSFEGQSFEINSVETWSLSDNGNTLTISSTTNTPQGDMNRKLVYDKK